MNQWRHEQHADRITFVPDGNDDFTPGMGMLVPNRDFAESTIRAVSGHSTVPQVYIKGKPIGGSEELEAHLGYAVAA